MNFKKNFHFLFPWSAKNVVSLAENYFLICRKKNVSCLHFILGKSSKLNSIYVEKSLTSCYKHEIHVHILFVDFKKAHDSMSRKAVDNALEGLQIPRKLIKLMNMTL